MRNNLYILLTVLAMTAAPAYAADSQKKTVITFRDGASYEFSAFDMAANGTTRYHVTHHGKRAHPEYFDGEALQTDGEGEIGCFDMSYDAATDLLFCSEKNGYQGWYLSYFRGNKTKLKLMRVEKVDLDDPDTAADEEKTTIVYEAK